MAKRIGLLLAAALTGLSLAALAPAGASAAKLMLTVAGKGSVTETTPAPGSRFRNWGAGCTPYTSATCTMTMTDTTYVNAFIYAHPANDNFANAHVIDSGFHEESSISGATGEDGEPNHAGVAAPNDS